jgi:hypothetical protein
MLTVKNNSVTLSTLGIVTGTDKFEILPVDTFGTLLGTSLPVQGTPAAGGKLAGAATMAQADTVSIWNGTLWLTFWFNTTLNHWVQGDTGNTTDRNNYVIRPDAGILVTRKGDAVTLTLVGRTPASSLRARYLNSGVSFVGLFPITTTLAGLQLQNLPGWVGVADSDGTTSTAIDRVSVWNGTQWLTFYYDTSTSIWRRTTDGSDRSTYTVQTPDRPIMIQKAGTATGSSYLAQSAPY